MNFSCADDVGDSIAKYVISRDVALKVVRSEPAQITVKCDDDSHSC